MYNEGISRHGDILDLGADLDVINKSGGAWYSYGDLRLGQGRENAKEFLRENPELTDELEEIIRQAAGLSKGEEEVGAKEDE